MQRELAKAHSQNISFDSLTLLISLQILMAYLPFSSVCYSQGWITQKLLYRYAFNSPYKSMHSFFSLWDTKQSGTLLEWNREERSYIVGREESENLQSGVYLRNPGPGKASVPRAQGHGVTVKAPREKKAGERELWGPLRSPPGHSLFPFLASKHSSLSICRAH